MNAQLTSVGQAPLRAGQFVSGTGNPDIYKAASDYNIQTLVGNQQALTQKQAVFLGPTVAISPPKVAFGAGGPVPFFGRS
jgi:hypothetical protein